MFRFLFHRLRRCRVLFALACCAWLSMGSLAWAGVDCCAEQAAPMAGMSMHDMAHMHGDHGQPVHHHAAHCTCGCVQATLVLPSCGATAQVAPSARAVWMLQAKTAPQPGQPPPLRPPAA